MLTGWRIVPASTADKAFTGEGARLYGGRWNSVGVPVVYASEHQSLAALETRVHIDTTRKIKRYKCFAFHFDEKLMQVFRIGSLPEDWQDEPPPPSVQAIGDAWVKAADSVILAVPSVIIPAERNYLINPNHSDFKKIKIENATDFAFDPRLLK
ncbi:MAG TPA: RES family NAD+ phosphorylase [Verrucomicrobiae bacterium]|nr:RES family NAD+ phosphorylase [Verrucomicrobiae bacterium]